MSIISPYEIDGFRNFHELFSLELDFTLLELDSTLLELDFTLLELDSALLELDFTLLELDFALLELDFTLLELDFALLELDFTLLELDFALLELDFALLELDGFGSPVMQRTDIPHPSARSYAPMEIYGKFHPKYAANTRPALSEAVHIWADHPNEEP